MNDESAHICAYCGRPAKYYLDHFRTIKPKWCCKDNHGKCPANIERSKMGRIEKVKNEITNGEPPKRLYLWVGEENFEKLQCLATKNNVKIDIIVNAFIDRCIKEGEK